MNIAEAGGATHALLWNSIGATIVVVGSVIAYYNHFVVDDAKSKSGQVFADIFVASGAAVIAVPAFIGYVNPAWDGWVFAAVWVAVILIVVGGFGMAIYGAPRLKKRREREQREKAEADAAAQVQRAQITSEAVKTATAAVRTERVPVALAAGALGAALTLLVSVIVRRR